MPFIKVNNLKKIYQYDDYAVLYDLSFDIDRGQVTTLIVGKGCGKTTIAKIFVGVEQKTQGDIFFDDIPIENLPPRDRKIAFI
ncbi:MAG: ATP-binding cassette domain-containing protein, partial [Clostridia bacterium]|nr:ATP-binding cassette domain-containing protein [Clostridia bacterium]